MVLVRRAYYRFVLPPPLNIIELLVLSVIWILEQFHWQTKCKVLDDFRKNSCKLLVNLKCFKYSILGDRFPNYWVPNELERDSANVASL